MFEFFLPWPDSSPPLPVVDQLGLVLFLTLDLYTPLSLDGTCPGIIKDASSVSLRTIRHSSWIGIFSGCPLLCILNWLSQSNWILSLMIQRSHTVPLVFNYMFILKLLSSLFHFLFHYFVVFLNNLLHSISWGYNIPESWHPHVPIFNVLCYKDVLPQSRVYEESHLPVLGELTIELLFRQMTV